MSDDPRSKLDWLGGPIEQCVRESHDETPREWCQDCQRAGRVPHRTLEEAVEKARGEVTR